VSLLPDMSDNEVLRIAEKVRDSGIESLTDDEREAFTRIKAVSIAEMREKLPTDEELADAVKFGGVAQETVDRIRRMLGREDA
jgi:hypothetical protein